jgi:crotonobetainyl-CoA:carnitine CoA-transferase CaiB-like acyl-CoA transferase
VAIVGHSPPNEEKAGHDLTYQAELGLVDPPQLPKTVLADLAGAEWAVSAALTLLLGRFRSEAVDHDRGLAIKDRYIRVSLADAAKAFATPLRHGLTSPGGLLNGSLPVYNLYQAEDGWLALAALEPHFMRTLASELSLEMITYETLAETFKNRPAEEWESWARERDLPLVAVRNL